MLARGRARDLRLCQDAVDPSGEDRPVWCHVVAASFVLQVGLEETITSHHYRLGDDRGQNSQSASAAWWTCRAHRCHGQSPLRIARCEYFINNSRHLTIQKTKKKNKKNKKTKKKIPRNTGLGFQSGKIIFHMFVLQYNLQHYLLIHQIAWTSILMESFKNS